ncbi:twin-arginine translocase TatA/TatE family subunit [Acidiferrobacter sp.]|uniref:Sec-independent protein translocase subunit TatA/TatB n=1 Tax=Acidiferrobacter sp. TaxID=1872107 RepID=UPI00261B40A0|nr:twin-arginine translocase TatA/TatE family subunit [Acidiferrobacter sp.]
MFDFSFTELLIIGVVAVIVFDPRHLPDAARGAGRWVVRARRFVAKLKEDLDGHVGTEHLAPLRELNQEWQRTKALLQDSLPSEWQESLGDESPDRVPPALEASPDVPRRPPSAPGRRRRRRGRRRPANRASAGAPSVGKGDGGEGV